MKFLVRLLVLIIVAGAVGYFLPFWAIGVVAFFFGLANNHNGWSAFFAGFIGIFLLWFGLGYLIDTNTDSILTVRIAEIFSLSPLLLMLVTGLIGGFVGGFCSATGQALRSLFSRNTASPYR